MEISIEDLTLLLMYLTGWEEDSRKNPGEKLFCSWNGFSFKAINNLNDNKLITTFKGKKITFLTPEGIKKAQELKKKIYNE